MRAGRTGPPRARQRGVAAVELALLLPMLLAVLSVMMLAVQAFLYYNVMQDAVQSAARFMAATSAGDMSRLTRRAAAMRAARLIVTDAAAASGLPPFELDTQITVMCDNNPCDNNTLVPATIRVFVLPFELPSGALPGFRATVGGNFSISLDAMVPYGG